MISIANNDDKDLRFKKFMPRDKWNEYYDMVNVYGSDAQAMFENYIIDPIKLFQKIGKEGITQKLFGFWFHYGYKNFEKLNINKSLFKHFDYECFYNGYQHRSIMPLCIISDDQAEEKYLKFFKEHPYKEMVLDKEWNLAYAIDKDEFTDENVSDKDISEILYSNIMRMQSSISKMRMGSGYNESCIDTDGSWERRLIALKLSNGDYLICTVMFWYNK